MSTGLQPGRRARRTARTTRRAWIALAFLPVAFVVAMVLGEGLLSLQGYESGDEDIPFGAVLLAGGSAVLVLEAPCVAAWGLGRRAVRAGESSGKAPALVGAVVGGLLLAQNLLVLVLGR